MTPHTAPAPTARSGSRLRIMTALLTTCLLLTSCLTSPKPLTGDHVATNQPLPPAEELSDEEYWQRAKTQFTAFHDALAPLHQYIYDGQWRSSRSPATSSRCSPNGYGWNTRASSGGGNLPELTHPQSGQDIQTWLQNHGWHDIRQSEYNEERQVYIISASHRALGIHDIIIRVDSTAKYVSVQAESLCYHGDRRRLSLLIFPDDNPENPGPGSDPIFPETFTPGDPPTFRYSIQDGNARPL